MNLKLTPLQLVEQGYNKMGQEYHAHRDIHKIDQELLSFVEMMPKNAKVLDAGAGAGVPGALFLANHGIRVTGIDLSETMISLAQQNVPQGRFIKMDMRSLLFPDHIFEGIICLFAIFHVPGRDHKQIFKEFYRVLKPNGKLMVNTGLSENQGISHFFGVPMYWSNLDPSQTKRLIQESGLQITFDSILTRGGETQYWIVAEKPKGKNFLQN